MHRKNIYLSSEQETWLELFAKEDGTSLSEHLRLAVNEYIEKKRRTNLNISSSPSKLVKGAKLNG